MWMSIRSSPLVLALLLGSAAPALAQEPPTSAGIGSLRERFDAGMDKYRANAFAEAIVIWEAVYRELGTEKGYRLAFNLGRAYDHFGDTARAAEHYQRYLEETDRRNAAGEVLEPTVRKQEEEARERLKELGRPFIPPKAPATAPVTKDVDARPPPPPVVLRDEHPFDRSVLIVAAGVSAASIVAPVLFRSRATATQDDYYRADPAEVTEIARLDADYGSARSAYYASLAIPISLGAITLGLAAYWYLARTKTPGPVATAHWLPSGGFSW